MKKESLTQKLLLASIFILFLLGNLKILPCTVAVVSGKVTADGRPLMWKNRDTSFIDNKVLYITGAKYNFIGLINAVDTKGEEVWAGINTEGFAIMNAASPDFVEKDKEGSDNGRFMKLALGECSNASDFENLLKKTAGKYSLAANFGVIDAEGNACFYETGKSSFEKFDTKDPRVAPSGYIVRTNYAFTAPQKDTGGGYIRFERASHLFQTARAEGRLSSSSARRPENSSSERFLKSSCLLSLSGSKRQYASVFECDQAKNLWSGWHFKQPIPT